MSHIHMDIQNVSFAYEKNKPILQQVSFHAHEEDGIGLIGANGVGKSTLLKLLVGLELNFQGEIRVEEIPLGKDTLTKVREKIGYVFQDSDSQLFMTTVREDVAFAPKNYGLPGDEVERRVENALEAVQISHLADRPIYKLSGGEKKRCEIFQMAMLEPVLSILDETDSGLDVDALKIVAQGVNALRSPQTASIIITHYHKLLEYIVPDVVHVLKDGRIVKTAGRELISQIEANGFEGIDE